MLKQDMLKKLVLIAKLLIAFVVVSAFSYNFFSKRVESEYVCSGGTSLSNASTVTIKLIQGLTPDF